MKRAQELCAFPSLVVSMYICATLTEYNATSGCERNFLKRSTTTTIIINSNVRVSTPN
jgi:hypothetical protein